MVVGVLVPLQEAPEVRKTLVARYLNHLGFACEKKESWPRTPWWLMCFVNDRVSETVRVKGHLIAFPGTQLGGL